MPKARRPRGTEQVKYKRQRHPLRALPLGISLSDFFWEPTRGEIEADQRRANRLRRLEYLAKLKESWEREDCERLRRRAAELAVVVENDRAYIERVNAIERAEAWHKKQI